MLVAGLHGARVGTGTYGDPHLLSPAGALLLLLLLFLLLLLLPFLLHLLLLLLLLLIKNKRDPMETDDFPIPGLSRSSPGFDGSGGAGHRKSSAFN